MSNEERIRKLVMEDDPDNPLSYVENIVKDICIGKVNKYILNCRKCENICNCHKTITDGNPNACVLIIGDSPSLEQGNIIDDFPYSGDADSELPFDQTDNDVPFSNLPFFNEAGDILFKVLNSLNVNSDEIFYINSVNCVPYRLGKNNEKIKRAPTVKEKNNCKLYLDYVLKVVQPLLIICLGGVATNDINEEIGKHNISQIRGEYFNYRGINVMPTYNPGYFIELEKSKRFDEETVESLKWDFFNDIKKAFTDLQEEYPEINIINSDEGNE